VIVAAIMKTVVIRVLKAIKVKPLTDKVGLNKVFNTKIDLVNLAGDLVKWFFIVVFLMQALSIAHLQQVNDVVNHLLGYIPQVLAAAALVFVGAVIADLASRVASETAKVAGGVASTLIGSVVKYSIWVVVIFTALAQLGINTLFLDRLFTAIVVMLAIAGGLAFGLGGRDMAKDLLDKAKSGLKK